MHRDKGPEPSSQFQESQTQLKRMNDALTRELADFLRARRHYFAARGIQGRLVAGWFLAHSKDDLEHADWIADRIVQLGGDPGYSVDSGLAAGPPEPAGMSSLEDLIQADLVSARAAVCRYRELAADFGNEDSTTRHLMEEILRRKEQHVGVLAKLLPYQEVAQPSDTQLPHRPSAQTEGYDKGLFYENHRWRLPLTPETP